MFYKKAKHQFCKNECTTLSLVLSAQRYLDWFFWDGMKIFSFLSHSVLVSSIYQFHWIQHKTFQQNQTPILMLIFSACVPLYVVGIKLEIAKEAKAEFPFTWDIHILQWRQTCFVTFRQCSLVGLEVCLFCTPVTLCLQVLSWYETHLALL